MAITVILHTINGDVRTTFAPGQEVLAVECVTQYTLDGKSFSVEQHKF